MTFEDQLCAVGRLLCGSDPATVANETGVTVETLSWWERRARSVLRGSFQGREDADARLREAAQEVELLYVRIHSKNPHASDEIRKVSRIISPTTGRPYGLARVCRVWRAPRSSLYESNAGTQVPARRGRPPAVSDGELDAAIVTLLGATHSSPLPSAPRLRRGLEEALHRPIALRRVRAALGRLRSCHHVERPFPSA